MPVQAVMSPNIAMTPQEVKDKATMFVNLNDSQLRMLAVTGSYNEKEAKTEKKLMAVMFAAIPVIDSITRGVLHESNSLGSKMGKTGKAAASWAGIIALVDLYSATKKAISKKNQNVHNFETEHPGLSFAVDLGALIGGTFLGYKGLIKITEKCPSLTKNFNKYVNKAKEGLDKTSFNKKTLPMLSKKASNFEEKAPRTAGVSKFILINSMWFMLGAALLESFHQTTKHNNKIENNYQTLKTLQIETAQHMKDNANI